MKKFFKEVFDDVIGGFILSDLLPLIFMPYNSIIGPIILWLSLRNADSKDRFEFYSEHYHEYLDNYEWYKAHASLMVHYSLSTLYSYIYQKIFGKKLRKISMKILKEREI